MHLFERFYNAGRNTADQVAMPDIDTDIPYILLRRRQNFLRHLEENKHYHKFGRDYRCELCGLLEKEYHMDKEPKVCPESEIMKKIRSLKNDKETD